MDYESRLLIKEKELEECRRYLAEAKERIINLTFETQVQNAVINNDNNALASFASIMEEDIPPPPPPLELDVPKIPKGAVSVFGSGLASQLANVSLKKKRTPPRRDEPQRPQPGSKGFIQSLAQQAKEQKEKLASMKPREIPKTTDLEKKREEAEKRALLLKSKKYGVNLDQLKLLMNEATKKNITLERLVEELKKESVKREISLSEFIDEKYNKPAQPLKRLKSIPKEKSPSPPKPKTPPPVTTAPVTSASVTTAPVTAPSFTIGVADVPKKRRGYKKRGSQKKKTKEQKEQESMIVQKLAKTRSSRSPSPKTSSSISSSGGSPQALVKSTGIRKLSPPRKNPQDLLAEIRKGAKLKKITPPKEKERAKEIAKPQSVLEKAFSKIQAVSPKSPLSSEGEWMSS